MTISVNVELDLSQLTTRAHCDAVIAELTFERKTYTTRDANIDLADDRADRRQGSATAALAKVDGEIAKQQAMQAAPGLDAEAQQDIADALEALRVQRKKILKRTRQAAGPAQFLLEVDGIQVDTQVVVLTAIIDAVAAHRDTLAA